MRSGVEGIARRVSGCLEWVKRAWVTLPLPTCQRLGGIIGSAEFFLNLAATCLFNPEKLLA